MLKKIFTLLLISLLTANVTARAQKQDQIEEVRKPLRNDQYGLFNHLGLGIDLISPDGFGINVGTCITPWLQVRAGYSIVPGSKVTILPQAGYSSTGLTDETVQIIFVEAEKTGDAHTEKNELIEVFELPVAQIRAFLDENTLPIGIRAQLVLEMVAQSKE